MKKWYWISFIDTTTHESLGCCNVEAENELAAVKKTIILGINPGGEVMITPMPLPEIKPDTLVSKEVLLKEGYKNLQQAADKLKRSVKDLPNLTFICQKCNQAGCNCNN